MPQKLYQQPIKRNSTVVEMLAKVPMRRGSLLKSIDDLLRTIESSENSVMIPTLLRDKVRVDAWELLFVAKILKASILGQNDLVEFYMNHVHGSGAGTPMSGEYPAGLSRQQTSPALSASSWSTARQTNGNGKQQHQQAQDSNQIQLPSHQGASSTGNSSPDWSSGRSSSESSLSSTIQPDDVQESPPPPPPPPAAALAASTNWPQASRQAQPPSLLQLTTTTNHINSHSATPTPTTIEQLANKLASMTQQLSSDPMILQQLTVATGSSQQQSPASSPARELRTSRSAGCLFTRSQTSNQLGQNSGQLSPSTPANGPQAETVSDPTAGGLVGDPTAPVKLLMLIEQLKTSIDHVNTLLESVVDLYKRSIDNIV